VTAASILAKLERGAATWEELPDLPNKDILVGSLLKSRKAMKVMRDGVVVFSLFAPIPERRGRGKSKPPDLSGPMRRCNGCGDNKYETQFGKSGNGKRGKICYECRYRRKQENLAGHHMERDLD
jgi:hypothetical protein